MVVRDIDVIASIAWLEGDRKDCDGVGGGCVRYYYGGDGDRQREVAIVVWGNDVDTYRCADAMSFF